MLFVLASSLGAEKRHHSTDINLTNQIFTQGKILDIYFGKTVDSSRYPRSLRIYTISYKKRMYSCFVETSYFYDNNSYSTGAFACHHIK